MDRDNLQLRGLPHSTLNAQRRMVPEIAALVNELFYNNQLTSDEAVFAETPVKRAIVDWNTHTLEVASPVVLVNVADSIEVVEGPTKFTTIFAHVEAVKLLTRLLLSTNVVQPQQLVILSPYEAEAFMPRPERTRPINRDF